MFVYIMKLTNTMGKDEVGELLSFEHRLYAKHDGRIL